MLGYEGQKQEQHNRGKKKNKKSLQDSLEGGTAGEDAGSLWEEISSPTSKTGAGRGWLEWLACSIPGHLPSACLDHIVWTCAGYGPETLRGSATLSLGVPCFPWPMSVRGCGRTQPSMPHFGCWREWEDLEATHILIVKRPGAPQPYTHEGLATSRASFLQELLCYPSMIKISLSLGDKLTYSPDAGDFLSPAHT